jgi:hypothetical protein
VDSLFEVPLSGFDEIYINKPRIKEKTSDTNRIANTIRGGNIWDSSEKL